MSITLNDGSRTASSPWSHKKVPSNSSKVVSGATFSFLKTYQSFCDLEHDSNQCDEFIKLSLNRRSTHQPN